ncbi:MbtH family protein [Streptomyces sp. R21]|uniref:MbtH family protein n=1 Tax=Streptomyces sp. R21 TaxID=3238627 RepID=A0AB39NY43_9ACTN
MPNPFDDAEARFYVLANESGHRSLWPVLAEVPAGWTVLFGEETHDACLAHLELR